MAANTPAAAPLRTRAPGGRRPLNLPIGSGESGYPPNPSRPNLPLTAAVSAYGCERAALKAEFSSG